MAVATVLKIEKMNPLVILLCLLLPVFRLAAQHPDAGQSGGPQEATLRQLHRQLRETLRMQLPPTLPEKRDTSFFKKNYSIDYRWSEADSSYYFELPEKRLDPQTEQISGAGRYEFTREQVDPGKIQLRYSEDGKQVALVLPAREGQSFRYHPYGNQPDATVGELLIGWYERVQETTLRRLEGHFLEFFKAMAPSK